MGNKERERGETRRGAVLLFGRKKNAHKLEALRLCQLLSRQSLTVLFFPTCSLARFKSQDAVLKPGMNSSLIFVRSLVSLPLLNTMQSITACVVKLCITAFTRRYDCLTPGNKNASMTGLREHIEPKRNPNSS